MNDFTLYGYRDDILMKTTADEQYIFLEKENPDIRVDYEDHFEELQSLSVNEIEDIVLPDENEIVGRIFTDVRETIQNEIAAEAAKRSEELPEEQPAVQAAPQPSPSEEQPESEPAVPEGEPEEDFIEQLEKKVEKHNGMVERMIEAEDKLKSHQHQINDLKERIDNL